MTTEKLERPGRATPGQCVNGHPVTDAPETGNVGYGALFPARHEDGTPKTFIEHGDRGQTAREITPASKRTLCRACYQSEWEEKYPGGLDKYGDSVSDPFPSG